MFIDRLETAVIAILATGIPVLIAAIKARIDEKKAKSKVASADATQTQADAEMQIFVVKQAEQYTRDIIQLVKEKKELAEALENEKIKVVLVERELESTKVRLLLAQHALKASEVKPS